MTPTTTNPLFKFGVDLRRVDAETGRTALHSAAMFPDAEKVTACRAHLPAFTSSGGSARLRSSSRGCLFGVTEHRRVHVAPAWRVQYRRDNVKSVWVS